MYIKMKKTAKGAEEGIYVKTYDKGEEYEVSDTLGKSFISGKQATKIDPPEEKEEEDEKEDDEEEKEDENK